MESVKKTLGDMEELRPHLIQFLSLADADVLANMPPLERAHSLFMLSKATTILFALRLRCTLRPFTTLSHQAATQISSDEEDVELDLAEAWGGGKVNDGASGLGGDGDLESEIAHCDPHQWAWIHFSPAK
ncbi:hypothetical protein ACFX13_039237 [Malus domestica]